MSGRVCDDPQCNCRVCDDCRPSSLAEDSQLEYLSAHEPNFDDSGSSSEFSEQRETTRIKILVLMDPDHEVPGAELREKQYLADGSDNCSEYGEGDKSCPEAAVPELPHLLEDSLADCSDTAQACQEERREYHSALCGSLLESHSWSKEELLNGSTLPACVATSEEVSMVNQAVDVSSEFRACFTTSRSTSPQVCLSSRATNTEITMMSKCRPTGWHSADVGCNTEWSFGVGTEQILSPLTEVLAELPSDNAAAAEGSSKIQEKQESENEPCSGSLGTSSDRPVRLDQEAARNSMSDCCQKQLQRAIKAELQVLKMRYQKCYQYYWKSYRQALEGHPCVWRCQVYAKLRSSLLLDLEALKNDYNYLKMQIKMGVPLKALPPLSIEMELSPDLASCVTWELFEEDLDNDYVSESDMEAPELQERSISVSMESLQALCGSDGHQPRDFASSEPLEERREDQPVRCGQVKNEERSECWFEAAENLTAMDLSEIAEAVQKQQEEQGPADLREAKTTEREAEGSFVCVSSPSSSLSEGDLRSHFQKYQVSDTLLSVDSSNCRYTNLCFNDADKAKLAVEETNHKEIKGRPVTVELVNTSSEIKHHISQVLARKLWLGTQPFENGQRNSQEKTLISASNSVQPPDATWAAEKMQPTTTSEKSCTAQVLPGTECPGLTSSAEVEDAEENSLWETPEPFSTSAQDAPGSASKLKSSSFAKIVKKLEKLHPEVDRSRIADALLELRKSVGLLSGLSISAIVERTSVILQKLDPSCTREKHP